MDHELREVAVERQAALLYELLEAAHHPLVLDCHRRRTALQG